MRYYVCAAVGLFSFVMMFIVGGGVRISRAANERDETNGAATRGASTTQAADSDEKAKIQAANRDMVNMEIALDMYMVDMGHYPSTLDALVTGPGGKSNWSGPYMKKPANDPWGNPYFYQYPGTHNKTLYDFGSFGPDGKKGTADDICNFRQTP